MKKVKGKRGELKETASMVKMCMTYLSVRVERRTSTHFPGSRPCMSERHVLGRAGKPAVSSVNQIEGPGIL